jgi:hypothetical protein
MESMSKKRSRSRPLKKVLHITFSWIPLTNLDPPPLEEEEHQVCAAEFCGKKPHGIKRFTGLLMLPTHLVPSCSQYFSHFQTPKLFKLWSRNGSEVELCW